MSSVQLIEWDTLCDSDSLEWNYMAWAKRQYSKGQIDRAGASLLNFDSSEEFESAITIVSNWRACHSYPLHIIKKTLKHRAKAVRPDALIAQRLKRLQSVILKLSQNKHMKLSQMQDIGGCRVVMPDMLGVRQLIALYDESRAKNPRSGRPIEHERYDYITAPKPDGYRSVHLIFKYQSQYADKQEFNGQRIEIQIRSKLQHAWATALETVQAFTGQALKSKIKTADPRMVAIFRSMGSALALREEQPLVPDTPTKKEELVKEIRELSRRLTVDDSLRAWGFAAQKITENLTTNASLFLLLLNTEQKQVVITPVLRGRTQQKAYDEYLALEKQIEKNPAMSAVLVAVESIADLQAAYPNYFLDTDVFLEAMNAAIA